MEVDSSQETLVRQLLQARLGTNLTEDQLQQLLSTFPLAATSFH